MKRFVEGEDRLQGALLPHCLDDYVTENNPVRVIEAFILELRLHVRSEDFGKIALSVIAETATCDVTDVERTLPRTWPDETQPGHSSLNWQITSLMCRFTSLIRPN